MRLLRFFVVHSWRDMWRNRSRTAFALVCVATGVAAVVALRSLAFMVADELTTNLAEINRGDMRVYAPRNVGGIAEFSAQGDPVFTREAVDVLRRWASEENVTITLARMTAISTARRVTYGQSEPPKPVITLFVEPEHYPFYSTITLDDPPGKPLAHVLAGSGTEGHALASATLPRLAGVGALTAAPSWGSPFSAAWGSVSLNLIAHPRPLVISSNLALSTTLGLRLGDIVRLGPSHTLYVVSGIAPATTESILSVPETVFFDFMYLPLYDMAALGDPALPDQMFVKVPLGQDVESIESSLFVYLYRSFETTMDLAKEIRRDTVPSLEEANSETAEVIDDTILVMGLSALLIGGIGIINTMLVVVSRRTVEIAVLKTLGLKGYRVTGLFLVEAALMGLVGSVLGVVGGVILSYLIKNVGEAAFSLTLHWRLYPEAMVSGIFLGMIITVLFGFLPTLIAGQVRPAVVLRPNEAQMPAAGLLQTLITLAIMIVVLGLLVNTIIGGVIHISPVIMIAGAGALVGLFGGVIVGNTRLGQPIPEYFQMRLPRRFERLENGLLGAVGALIPRTRRGEPVRRERGRRFLTAGLRATRQIVLVYGSILVGVALASGIAWLLAQLWVPFGLGEHKPAIWVVDALARGSAGWVIAWCVAALAIGVLVRWQGRSLVGVIALASLGVSVGAELGLVIGLGLEGALDGTRLWTNLARVSPGIVIVEGALALLGVIFVGYWLLVWLMSRMPSWLLMGLVSVTLLALIAGATFGVALWGAGALAALALLSTAGWFAVRRIVGGRFMLAESQRHSNGIVDMTHTAARVASFVLLSLAALASGVLLAGLAGERAWWGGALAGVVLSLGAWRYLRRHHSVDARLVLREMAGRRSRIASTLLGLSVGIAGLSIVSLTTGAASQILERQLNENVEGNLLIVARSPGQLDLIRNKLDDLPGVAYYSQFTTYLGVLMEINGEPARFSDPHGFMGEGRSGQDDDAPGGIPMLLAERGTLEDLPDYRMVSGRSFQPEDAGTHTILLRETMFIEQLGIKTGDRLLFKFENRPGEADDVLIRLTVIGLIARQSEQTGFADRSLVAPGTLPETVIPLNSVTVAMIDESSRAYMDAALVAMAEVPGVIPIELSALTQLLKNLLEKLKAIPSLVAWLALFAGTAIIANTVALATQERRRQIGVMKAIGLKGGRVLGMLIIENGLIGLIAGLIGAGVGLVLTVILVLVSQPPDELRQVLSLPTLGWLVVLSVGVAIGAATLSAWSAAAEKPMNVLRYE